MVAQVLVHLLDHVSVVRPVLCQPKDRWRTGGSGPNNGELHPVLDRAVLRLAHAPNIALRHVVAKDNFTSFAHHDANDTVCGHDEGFVMRTILLGLGRHQADVGRVPARRCIQMSVRLTVFYDGVVYARIAPVRDHEFGIAQGVVLCPHATGVTNGCRHRGIDDDVRGHMEVRNAAPRINVGDRRTLIVARHQIGLNFGLLRMSSNLGVDIAQAVLAVHTKLVEQAAVLLESGLVKHFHGVSKEHRVGYLHHRGLQVQRPKRVLVCGLQRLLIKSPQRGDAHDARVDYLAGQQRRLRLQHCRFAAANQFDPHAA
mmetsp:Transcript_71754/g.199076  ORF Transcript_71754/g.199076 Transcript_71754/m.199076 type:complete len:314 (-) Transcript_71754:123-1064(-)